MIVMILMMAICAAAFVHARRYGDTGWAAILCVEVLLLACLLGIAAATGIRP